MMTKTERADAPASMGSLYDVQVRAAPTTLPASVILVRYVLFAAVSGIANVATQAMVSHGLPVVPIFGSVFVGTGVGFIVKYLLEKRWVFDDRYESPASEVRKVLVYGCFGVGTTLAFWVIELGVWSVYRTAEAKYVGAAIGLILGNVVKYQLDKRYVFPRAACPNSVPTRAG